MSDEIIEARERETSFVSYVSGVSAEESARARRSTSRGSRNPRNKKFKGFFQKKRGPLFLLIALLAVGVGLLLVSQFAMPIALVNRFREEFNSIGISSILRADNLLDTQLESYGSFLGLSETQTSAFKEEGIYPVNFRAGDATSPLVTALVFEKSSGKYAAVVPKSTLDSASADSIDSAINSVLSGSSISVSESPISVADALNLPAFKDRYVVASKTWRGGSSGWYDSITDLTEARLAISRTRYANWATRSLTSGTHEAWKKLASGNVTASDSGISDYGTIVDVDENGNEISTTNSGKIDSTSLTSQTTLDGIRNALNSKIASVAKVAATAGCAGVEIATSIITIVSAQQSLQYINFASGFNEAVNSAQMGANDGGPMNEYSDALTRKDPETGYSAMESSSIASLFSGSKVDPTDEAVKTVNIETTLSTLGTLTSNVRLTAEAFEACSYVKMGVAAANFATTILEFVPVLGQAVSVIHIVAKVVGRLALGVAVGAIASFIVPKIVTQIAKNILENTATDWVGKPLGEALVSGEHKYLAGNFQTGGGSAADASALSAYKKVQSAVLADESATERRTRSPFDTTTNSTFLGSIAYALIPLASSTTVGSVVKSFGNLLRSSVSTLLPSASAIAETELLNSVGECPLLTSVGMVGDPACNPYYPEDVSTVNETPAESDAKVASYDPNNFLGEDENGQKIINPAGRLAKKSLVCDQRVASFGIADATAVSILVNQPSALVANIPLIGDAATLISAAGEAENSPWISGLACGNTAENPYREEVAEYSNWTKLQRFYESAGLVEKSAVTAFLEDYYEKNPLDNSYAGILARYSGMEKSDVLATLDYIDALDYIASYDASSRLAFGEDEVSASADTLAPKINAEPELSSPSSIALEPKYLVYSDLRSRATTV